MQKAHRTRLGARPGRVDHARLDSMTEAEIEAVRDPDIPDDIDWSTVRVVQPTKLVSVRLPLDTIQWYKEYAGTRGYQRIIKRVLETFREQVSKR